MSMDIKSARKAASLFFYTQEGTAELRLTTDMERVTKATSVYLTFRAQIPNFLHKGLRHLFCSGKKEDLHVQVKAIEAVHKVTQL